jgi:copper chaperone CopZ
MSADAATTRTVRLRVEGMGCEGCVAAVRQALADVPGVTRVQVDLASGTAEVDAAPTATLQDLTAALDAAGYGAAPA